MKKIIIAALALSTLAAPAMAENWTNKAYKDGIATYDLNASVDTFCKFGATDNRGVSSNGGTDVHREMGLEEGDRTFNLNLQDKNNNTVLAARAAFIFPNAVCNTPFEVTAQSTNGGLKHTAIATAANPAFTTLITYGYNFVFGGNSGTGHKQAATTAQVLLDGTVATAGQAEMTFLVGAQDKLLLQGDYQDTVVVRLTPKS